MFYNAKDDNMPPGLLNSCDVPRSIFWVSTQNGEGVINLAPYSFSSAVAYKPPQVMFSITGLRKSGREADSLANIRETLEFVVNFSPYAFRNEMNQTCAPVAPEVDEMALAGLEAVPSTLVRPPGVKEAPTRLECRLYKIFDLLGDHNAMVVGEVLGIYIDDDILSNGEVDWLKYRPIARMGRSDGYTVVSELFFMDRPG